MYFEKLKIKGLPKEKRKRRNKLRIKLLRTGPKVGQLGQEIQNIHISSKDSPTLLFVTK